MAIFSPTRALTRVLLPTLGRPAMVTMAVFVMFSIEMILNFLKFPALSGSPGFYHNPKCSARICRTSSLVSLSKSDRV